jgi:UDP-glucose 4-epimerase
MKITVIGGSGFLGSHVADRLSKDGHEVIIFDQEESKWKKNNQEMIIGDILKIEELEKAISKSQIVYNFAAVADLEDALFKPIKTANVNILGTLNALELCKKHSVERFVFASTIYVYSLDGNFYRCSKQSAESFIEEYNKLYNLNYTILRYGSIYGPRSDNTNGLYKIIEAALDKDQIIYEGDKESRREYIHVEDAAEASVKILEESFKNQNIILTGTQSLKVYDIMKMISEILGIENLKFVEKKGTGHYIRTPYTYQPRIAKKYIPNIHYDLGQGLIQLIEEIKKEKN